MSYRFSAMLHIPGDVRDFVAFYGRAFGATIGWGTPPAADMVAQLLVQGAEFWVHPDGESIGNPSPAQLCGTAVRLMLIVDDPDAVFDQAVGAGAVIRSPCRTAITVAVTAPSWTRLGIAGRSVSRFSPQFMSKARVLRTCVWNRCGKPKKEQRPDAFPVPTSRQES